jgi:hypothetical protein
VEDPNNERGGAACGASHLFSNCFILSQSNVDLDYALVL